jgi:hypothetical protein
MIAKSIKGKSPEEIKAALEKSTDDGFKPTLAVIFLSSRQDIDAVRSVIDQKDIAIFGATTAGEFTDKGITEGSISILLLDMNPDYFKIDLDDIGDQSIYVISNKIGKAGIEKFNKPAFIISASNEGITGESIVEGILNSAGEDTTIIGGNAGDDLTYTGGSVFTNRNISRNGIIALVIDQEKIDVKGQAVSGWKAVGTPKTVTKSEGTWVYTIDDQPALDMLVKFTGIKVDTEKKEDLYSQIGESYPFQVAREKGNPVMKPPIIFNRENKAVRCGGIIPQGSKIRFSLPPDFDVIETVIESAEELKKNSLPEADGMMIFSCIGRLSNLGPLADKEIRGLKDVWNVPLAGFFSYGEFGTPPGGKADFHGTTCSWVALKEK